MRIIFKPSWIFFLWISLVAALGVIFAADHVLQLRSGWMKPQESKSSQSHQPFLADRLMPDKIRKRLRITRIMTQANEANTDEQRAELLMQAAGLLAKVDPEERIELLRRITKQCRQTPQAGQAWALLVLAELNRKNSSPPADEVQGLARIVWRMGLGPKKMDKKLFNQVVKSLKKKKYHNLVQKLDTARKHSRHHTYQNEND